MNIDQAYQTIRTVLRKIQLSMDDHEILQKGLWLLYEKAKGNDESKKKSGTDGDKS